MHFLLKNDLIARSHKYAPGRARYRFLFQWYNRRRRRISLFQKQRVCRARKLDTFFRIPKHLQYPEVPQEVHQYLLSPVYSATLSCAILCHILELVEDGSPGSREAVEPYEMANHLFETDQSEEMSDWSFQLFIDLCFFSPPAARQKETNWTDALKDLILSPVVTTGVMVNWIFANLVFGFGYHGSGFLLMLYSTLLLVIFGLRGYPGEGPPSKRTQAAKDTTHSKRLKRKRRQAATVDDGVDDILANIERQRQEHNIYQIEEEKLERAALQEDLCEALFSEVEEEPEEESDDPLRQAKYLAAKKMRAACSSVVASALALSDLSVSQKKDFARLLNGISRRHPKVHEERTLHVYQNQITKVQKRVEKELKLLGSFVKTKAKIWTGYKTVNGVRRSNNNVVMISSIPLGLFHSFDKDCCYQCATPILEGKDASGFLLCNHSKNFCEQCITDADCPICNDKKLRDKLESYLGKKIQGIEENNPDLELEALYSQFVDDENENEEQTKPWDDISVFVQRSGNFGALLYFKEKETTANAYDKLKQALLTQKKTFPGTRIWNYQNIKQTKDFLKRLDLRVAIERAINHTNWGVFRERRDLKLVLWSDGCGPYTISALVLLDPETGIFSEVVSFMWFQGGEHLLKLVFKNTLDGIYKLNELFGKDENGEIAQFKIDEIIDMGDHHLSNIMAGIGAGQSSFKDIHGHSLTDYSHLLPYHHWSSVWSVDERDKLFDHLQNQLLDKSKKYQAKYGVVPHKKTAPR